MLNVKKYIGSNNNQSSYVKNMLQSCNIQMLQIQQLNSALDFPYLNSALTS